MSESTVLTETGQWATGVYKLEVTDPIRGYNPEDDSDGPTNKPATDLANRTRYLYNIFYKDHNADGSHSLTNTSFTSSTNFPESKIAVAYSTSGLNTDINTLIDSEQYYIDNIPTHTLDGDPSIAWSLSQIVPLSWEKSRDIYAFELFTPSLTLSNGRVIKVTRAVIGDDSLDVEDNSEINVGDYYMLADETGANYQFVTIKAVYNPSKGKYLTGLGDVVSTDTSHTRILITEPSVIALSNNGYLRPTNVPFENMSAVTSTGDFLYISDSISNFVGHSNGTLIIQHTPVNQITNKYVEYKEDSATQWVSFESEGSIVVNGLIEDVFKIPDNLGAFKIRIRYLGMTQEPVVFSCIALIAERVYDIIEYIRKPAIESVVAGANNTYTVTCDVFGSLYGETFLSLDYQESSGYLFPVTVNSGNITTYTVNQTTKKISFTLSNATAGNYIRIRYRDDVGNISRWSTPAKVGA